MDAVENQDKPIRFELSRNEALVFFEWLGRFTAKERPEHFVHGAEEQTLFNFEACLEKILVEPFQEDYAELVKLAQERVFSKESST